MFGNVNDIMNLYRQMMNNPMEFLSKRFNIPQGINNPNDIVQYLLNTGQVTQTQVNRVMEMKNNPMIQKMFRR